MMEVEKIVARYLLEIEAVKLNPEHPFTWASGWKSPIYCDNRRILSYPELRTKIAEFLTQSVQENFASAETVAGVATGAIALGTMVADKMQKPFVYVRPKPKDHGMGAQVEGVVKEGSRVVVVEDLISTGKSSLSAVDALNKQGVQVAGMVAIFSYNFDHARKSFEDANVELHTLTNYDTLIEEAVACNYIKESELELLRQWRYAPDQWGK
ncbi:MAG: orotate phosphoribosyltransferase [Bacteroidales bacterium]|nr:orotate phosphoribosyltransferase [Bacteroidales bacterium]